MEPGTEGPGSIHLLNYQRRNSRTQFAAIAIAPIMDNAHYLQTYSL